MQVSLKISNLSILLDISVIKNSFKLDKKTIEFKISSKNKSKLLNRVSFAIDISSNIYLGFFIRTN